MGEKCWTVLELLQWTTDFFKSKGIETARLDAECLLARALGIERLQLYLDFEKPVQAEEREKFRSWVRERGNHRVPVSQILGEKEFWSLSLEVNSQVLTPRPDTETLVSAALTLLGSAPEGKRVLELGTGSGAIVLALASECPELELVATDLSEAALEVARRNASRLNYADRIHFLQGDWFEPLGEGRFHLLVSNPPYLPERERENLPPELVHEPELALFAEEEGLSCLRILVRGAQSFLCPGGWLALELDPDQVPVIQGDLLEAGYRNCKIFHDLAGQKRVVAAQTGQSV